MKFCIVDLETSGLEPTDDVIEIGSVMLQEPDAGDGLTWRHLQYFAKNTKPIPPIAKAVHHIDECDLESAAPWPDVLAEWLEKVDDADVFCAHNSRFELAYIGGAISPRPFICSYKCSLRVWPDAPGHSNQVLRYWLNPDGLQREIANATHRALPDAYVTAFLLRELLRHASLADLIQWSTEPALLPRVPIGQQRGAAWSEVDVGFLKWILARDFNEDILHSAHTELERRRAEWRREHPREDAAT